MENIYETLEKLEEKLRTILTLILKFRLKLENYTFDSRSGAEIFSDKIQELLCDIDVFMDSAVFEIGDEIDMDEVTKEEKKYG